MVEVQLLSKNQQIVLEIIERAREPLKAYSIYSMYKKKELMLPNKFTEHWIN